MKVLVVTDPMCAWCWAMAPAVEEAAVELAGEAEFGVLLGGVNPSTTRPVGEYARRYLRHVWREVEATTGRTFSFVVPDGLVYNSTRPCLAVAAVRRELGRAPLGYLHRLQHLLFAEARDINDPELLCAAAEELGVPGGVVRQGLEDRGLLRSLSDEFVTSRSHGTRALPSVLVEQGGERALLAGGYTDADMLTSLVRQRL